MTIPANMNRLDTIEKLEQAISNSRTHPVLLFKHSVTCGISASVFRDVSGSDAPLNVVIVQDDREISREIERRTGIRHESPQAIILHNGEVVYHASHFDITADDIASRLA
ncbi:MAG: bacillithiol system redox-active protein YtxJ [Pyrinomonadaceae bacterium]